MSKTITALVGVALGGAFYMLLIDTVSLPELYAGAGATLVAGLAFAVSSRQGVGEASISPALLARGWRAIARVPTQIVLVCGEAISQLFTRSPRRGRFLAVPFEAGDDDPGAAGRRALAEAVGSLAPNTIVIGIDPDRKLLLVHQLHGQSGRDELDVLRLG